MNSQMAKIKIGDVYNDIISEINMSFLTLMSKT